MNKFKCVMSTPLLLPSHCHTHSYTTVYFLNALVRGPSWVFRRAEERCDGSESQLDSNEVPAVLINATLTGELAMHTFWLFISLGDFY